MLASSSKIISWINFQGVRLIILTSVRNKVEFPSLWKTIIIDVLGKWPLNCEWALQLKNIHLEVFWKLEDVIHTVHFVYPALHDLMQFDR